MTQPQTPVVHRLFDGVESQLSRALGAMAAGQACDLDGLADRVDVLCREALQVDANSRPAVLARLGQIVETLARLERDFDQARG